MDSNQPTNSEQSSESILDQAEALIWALLDDQIETADLKKLEGLLKSDDAVRQLYVECVHLHTDLHLHFGAPPKPEEKPELPKSPVLGSLGDFRPGTDTLPIRD